MIGLRRAGRPHQGKPRGRLEARKARFVQGRQVGRVGRALQRGDADAAHPAVAHQRQAGAGVLDADRHDAAHDVGQVGAAIGDVLHLDAGEMAEQLARHVLRRADARRAVAELAGIGLGVGDQVGDRLHRQVVVDEEDRGHGERRRDRRQVLQRIERQGLQAGQDGDGGVARPHQRVAVGRGLGDLSVPMAPELPAMFSTTTGWPQASGELLGEHAAGDVGGAAGGEAHHQLAPASRASWSGRHRGRRPRGRGRTASARTIIGIWFPPEMTLSGVARSEDSTERCMGQRRTTPGMPLDEPDGIAVRRATDWPRATARRASPDQIRKMSTGRPAGAGLLQRGDRDGGEAASTASRGRSAWIRRIGLRRKSGCSAFCAIAADDWNCAAAKAPSARLPNAVFSRLEVVVVIRWRPTRSRRRCRRSRRRP